MNILLFCEVIIIIFISLSITYSSRYFHWQLNLYLMLILVIIFIPLYSSHLIVSGIKIGNVRVTPPSLPVSLQHAKLFCLNQSSSWVFGY